MRKTAKSGEEGKGSVKTSNITPEQAEELCIDYEENSLLIAEFEPQDDLKGG